MDTTFSINLAEELVEEIVARMPLPSIFKARELSRAWLAKFSSISSQENQEKKSIAFRFQRLVCSNWSTFFFPVCVDDDIPSAYDCQRERWVTFPNLPFLQVEKSYGRWTDAYSKNPHGHLAFLIMDGILLCSVHHKRERYPGHGGHRLIYHVANILTGKWKELPPGPKFKRQAETMSCNPVFMSNAAQGTYKLILLHHCWDNTFRPWYAQIYDSISGGWSTKKLTITTDEACSSLSIEESGVCLNGIIYIFVYQELRCNSDILLALDIERGSFEKIQLSSNGFDPMHPNSIVNLVPCNGELMMVVVYPDPEVFTPECYPYLVFCVLKVDLGSRQILKVARAPSWAREPGGTLITCGVWGSSSLFTDGRCIFFRLRNSGYRTTQLVAYDVRQDTWRYQKLPGGITIDCKFLSNHLDLGLMHPFADV